ncbi:HAD family hydrolase [bacterium endosymbiont of Bathymodiolus sp. 5 South]|jgi:phosphoglycolate phosphatase|uniref:HAD family hydrolase n=1 Tax=bacterium endosymbiont of Bathymodiolus sp. 5 South TaxID=1181670 RepID=UPI0010B613DA|nr:HAD-IA family hydrolase [bacterium endosymbiont of Bathymodiolus sp. 5 South]CAC9435119.1 Similar to phosphoglycolate phosphatase, clustered with ubiquinone biosynthesis SAM-dependent O-methyltransferase [uncultured Gammaproteobacteria bacterium]CAC9645117.1 Similar to phosphoglycolate phosphatase, clustered with ubiquinone biosynthesis SAM-dependent O-methyltransferase [uncultured Gammaproteobacteria bacterium]CAC9653455.1 Similar to phosphoglycolate phosphatase, clustered with ubiquinone bi
MTLSTILFDLDGTLVDTAPDLAYALNALLLENGIEEKSYKVIKPLVAHGGKALITMGFECNESHPEFTQRHQRLLQIYTDNIDKHAKTFEGIDDLLALIKQRKLLWGIVTNKPENLSYLLLEKLGVKPDVVVCGDTLEHSKPHPAPLLYACAQLAVDPKSCLFVGDDKNDMIAGKNAGIKTVAVTYGYGTVAQDWGYDYLIDYPQEIQRLI